ncbi:MAG: glycine--tRNA ligase subunit beta [Burkholderiaceae bacterium]
MTTATLLVELQTEELPPKALKTLGFAFADRIVQGLVQAQLASAEATVTIHATPRRLGVSITDVLDRAPDRVETKKLMPAKVAYDASGAPTAALTKRLEKEGVAMTALSTRSEGGVDQVWLEQARAGSALAAGLQAALDDALAKLPIPKRMSYQRYDDDRVETTVQFVRPVHGLIALHGKDVVDIRALGISAGRITAGHRFMGMRYVTLADADSYAKTLHDDGKVVAGFAERRERIRAQLIAAAGTDRVVMPDALLDEVTALVEWPAVYRGTFDNAFLDVPQECLILTMQQNQKYFALTDAADRIVDRFLVVSNIATDEPSRIAGGNERVLRARLADAKFFFDQDRKRSLESRIDALKTVVYHNKLGSQYERMLRVEALAGRIAGMLGVDATDAQRAARLAKTDLVTDMVGEFPELQGSMGRYYALHDGEKPDVAAAIEEQYRPRFAGDALPATDIGTCLALADKLETLTGLFGIGAVPTGDKDPFALRRHALGVVRILIEKKLRVDLADLVRLALDVCPPSGPARADVLASLTDFIRVRLAGYCRDLGYSTNEVEAVVHGNGPIADLPKRLEAVRAFAALPESDSLASADKRVRNILGKSAHAHGHRVDASLLTADAELALYRALGDVGPRSAAAYDAGDFTGALLVLASLKVPVDRFFDEVMVNVDDPAVRANRLGLLSSLHDPMNRIADLSKLAA